MRKRTTRYIVSIIGLLVLSAVANGQGAPLAWAVHGPGAAITVTPDDRFPIVFVIGAQPANNVRVLSSSVAEQDDRTSIAKQGFLLCTAAQGAPTDPDCKVSVNITGTGTYWLQAAGGLPSAGHYTGSILVSSSVKPEGESVALDVYISTAWQKFFGAVAVLVGVGLSWLLTEWLRTRHTRAELLVPAAFLREQLQRVADALDTVPKALPTSTFDHTTRRLRSLQDRLTETALERERFIPRSISSPFGAPALDAQGYKALIEAVQKWIDPLLGVVAAIRKAAEPLLTDGRKEVLALVEAAVSQVDQLVIDDAPPTASTLATKLTPIQATLESELRKLSVPVPAPVAGASAAGASAQQIQLDLARSGALAWALTAVITTLIGWYVVVLSDLGFGTCRDYVMCVAWGLGLPIGAGLLQQTRQSVVTALKG